jgi:hypothetical protein
MLTCQSPCNRWIIVLGVKLLRAGCSMSVDEGHLMRYLLLFVLTLSVCSCSKPNNERFTSSLRDDLSGVWVYPAEQLGTTSITIVDQHRWRSFTYDPNRIDTETQANMSDSGEVLGEEGVYFFANPTNFYPPRFFQRAPNGTPYIILTRHTYDEFNRTGTLPVQIWIRAADKFDPDQPPVRPSIKVLGIPYSDIFKPKPD